MKRVLNLVAALALAAGLSVVALQPVQAASTATATVTTPSGKVVSKLPALPAFKPGKDARVFKGKPAKAGAYTTLASCDGVGTKACYLYNVGSQSGLSKNGVKSNVRVGGHTGALNTATDYHTLGELAVESSDAKQIVEVGWTVDPVINKTAGVGVTNPRPFVFSWVNGVGGVYNGGTFVPVSGATVVPGVTNLTPGALISITIWHDDTQNAWWIGWNTEWIGYFADTQWDNAVPSVNFDRMQYFQAFGEIASTESKPCSDMGLGVLPTDTVNSTKFSSVTYMDASQGTDPSGVNLYVRANPTTTAGSPYAGAIGAGSPPSTTNLRSFFYGGPMWNAAGTTAGSLGSC